MTLIAGYSVAAAFDFIAVFPLPTSACYSQPIAAYNYKTISVRFSVIPVTSQYSAVSIELFSLTIFRK
jgi:hypothetical protein